MAELTTLARPYAKAAFEVALADNDLKSWSSLLGNAAAVAQNGEVKSILAAPSLSSGQVAQAFIDICGDGLNDKGRNLIRLLAENKRLMLLPEISELYEMLKANQEKSLDVEVTTAFEISSEVSSALVEALKRRLQRDIRLATRVDQSLIGGALIRAGDTVIDNSVRGKLAKLAESMNS
ncbi:MAG: F0F1 ATP synthase subunit delta [Gammaproteobacteria bacterium]|nr:F0F1 ATP synthase subunit delta [Pseudomonadales bacterium]MCP5347745.1 F0F1 ATP synthase subunit delta [Pseudomonadales bacterium]